MSHTLEVRRGGDRGFQRIDGVLSRFSFPMAGNFDLTRNAHGALLVHNDDLVEQSAGFDRHAHREMEIVTWVISGSLQHEDSLGISGVLSAGQVQRMSAGSGITHAERNVSYKDKLRVVQAWLPPTEEKLPPSYEEADLSAQLGSGQVVTAVSGLPGEQGAVSIHNKWVALDVAHPRPGTPVKVAGAPFHHFYLTSGSATVTVLGADGMPSADPADTVAVVAGDAVRLTDAAGLIVQADPYTAPQAPLDPIDAGQPEFLVWRMHAHF